MTNKTYTLPILVFLLVIAAFLVGKFWTENQYLKGTPPKAGQAEGTKAVQATPVPGQPEQKTLGAQETAGLASTGPVKGNPNAKVTIVEFSDFQCPACGGAAPFVKQILTTYPSDVKLVFRQFPLTMHPMARPAALASLCAEDQGKFWEYHDKIFDNQQDLSEENLKKWAGEIGLNQAKFDSCFATKEYESRVNEDYDLGNKVGVGGTPTFFVNGKIVEWKDQTEGWFNALKRYIEVELTK